MDRIISKEQGEDLAAELGGGRIVHYETSARNNLGVTEVCYQWFARYFYILSSSFMLSLSVFVLTLKNA